MFLLKIWSYRHCWSQRCKCGLFLRPHKSKKGKKKYQKGAKGYSKIFRQKRGYFASLDPKRLTENNKSSLRNPYWLSVVVFSPHGAYRVNDKQNKFNYGDFLSSSIVGRLNNFWKQFSALNMIIFSTNWISPGFQKTRIKSIKLGLSWFIISSTLCPQKIIFESY